MYAAKRGSLVAIDLECERFMRLSSFDIIERMCCDIFDFMWKTALFMKTFSKESLVSI